jgi:iron complex transport system substrate-binding protein
MPHGIESVFLKAIDADYWLNPGSASTKAEITAIDSRLSGLSCFLKGNIFNNNKLVNANGGNDYWESGSLFPNIILRDIASVLHPELFPGNDLYYYKKIK